VNGFTLILVYENHLDGWRDIALNRGIFRNLSKGGFNFFLFPGGAQHLLGPENPLKSIDFTSPGGA